MTQMLGALGRVLQPIVNPLAFPSKTSEDLEQGVPLKQWEFNQKPVIKVDVQTGAEPVTPRIRSHAGGATGPALLADAAAAPAATAAAGIAAAEKKQRHWLSASLTTLSVIAIWYLSNTAMLLLNKHLLGGYGFRYPVFLTACHMAACVVMSQAADAVGAVPHQALQSRAQGWKVAALATAFLLSVVLGNVALRWIPVSFAQAMGAITPAMTAAMAWVLLGTVEKRATLATLVPVMGGIVLAAGFEPSYTAFGFGASMGAAAARALKAVLQGVLLADQAERLDSMNLLRLMAPIALGLLLPAIALLEPTAPAAALAAAAERPGFVALLAGNAALAYVVNFTNFQITKLTSALTLQVLGCAKGVVATVVSIMVFQNPVTVLGAAGYCLTVLGVFAYGWTKKHM